jgi:hypothetical protein
LKDRDDADVSIIKGGISVEQTLLPVIPTRAFPVFEMMKSLDISKNYLPINE